MDKQELDKLHSILRTELNTESGHELVNQLVEIEAWGATTSYAHRRAIEALSKTRNQMLLPKSKDYTDMDRTIQLDGACKGVQMEADHLGDLQELIKRRISLGQTLLKNVATELNSGLRL